MKINEIVNGQSIDDYQIDWTSDDLLAHIGENYSVNESDDSYIIAFQNFKFWIGKSTNTVQQIGVSGNYAGKLLGKIGLGSTLGEVRDHFGDWDEDLSLDMYIIPQCEGVGFEVSDNVEGEWLEEKLQINAIFVYNPDDRI